MNTILILARLTFREALRRKIVLAAVIMAIAFLVIYSLGFHFMRQEMVRERMLLQGLNFMQLAGMYVVNFLVIATAALITADSLAGEIQSGTIQAVATKPVRRIEIVLGKWLGNAGLLLLYLLLLGGGMVLIVWLISRMETFNWVIGLLLIYFNGLVILSLTLAFSSSLSTLATGGAVFGAFGLAFMGGWVERIGTVIQNQTAVNLGIFTSLLLPSEALWNKAAAQMSSPLIGLVSVTPFTAASEPSTLMIIYAGLYLLAALGAAVWRFARRDL